MRHTRGFTLIELTIVIVIVGILSLALIPKILGVQARARDTAREADSRLVVTALSSYANDHYGAYPDPVYILADAADSSSVLPTALAANAVEISTIDSLQQHLSSYISYIPKDPSSHGLGAARDGRCWRRGKSYAYYTESKPVAMFAITAVKESQRGNTSNCEGLVESVWGGSLPFQVNGQGLKYLTNDEKPGGSSNPGGGPQEGGGGTPVNPPLDPHPEPPIEGDACFETASIGGLWTITSYNTSELCPKDVVIKQSLGGQDVQAIGESAFKNLAIKSVVFPPTLLRIADHAFANNALKTLALPNSVTTISASAFAVNNLIEFRISSAVSTLDASALINNGPTHGSLGITDFVAATAQHWTLVGNKWVKDTPVSCFFIQGNQLITKYDPSCPKDVIIPPYINGIKSTSLWQYTFRDRKNADGITSVSIPETMTNIEGNAFFNNTLQSVYINDGLTTLNNGVFNNNYINFVRFPSTLKSIGGSTFDRNNLTTIDLPESVNSIGSNAFSNNNLIKVHLSSKVTSLGVNAFINNGPSKNSLGINDFVPGTDQTWNLSGQVWLKEGVVYDNPTPLHCFVMSNSTIMNYDPSCPKDVSIPDNLAGLPIKSIYNAAFQNKGINSVIIPNGITHIGDAAFRNNNLTEIIIPDSVTTIKAYAFQGNKLNSVTLPNNISSIQLYAFYNNNITSVNIPDSVQSIDANAFNANKLTSITIPNSVQTVVSSAFSSNGPNKNSFAINDFEPGTQQTWNLVGQSWIKENTNYETTNPGCFSFSNGTILTYNTSCPKDVIIPEIINGQEVKSIAGNAFRNMSLISVIIPDSVVSIGNWAFNNNQLQSVTLSNNLTKIENDVFSANKISSLIIPASVTSIAGGAFNNNRLTTLQIPSNVINIGNNAFASNNLTTISLGSSIESIGISTFAKNGPSKNSNGINDFEPGTEQTWNLVGRDRIKQ